MLGLLPVELWDYRLGDLCAAIISALGQSPRQQGLSLPGLGECIPARSARAGLVTAIQSLELPPQSRIGVPLYCCPVVFKAITMAGCVPRFIDVEPSTFCISSDDLSAKRAEVDAVIAVHMFGNVCNIPELRDAVGEKPIIEDCALSLGSRLNGRPTGTLGEIGVFSFRSGKYLSVGEGGALYANDPELRRSLLRSISALPASKAGDELIHIVKTYLRSALRSKPLYGLLGHALWEKYNQRAEYSDKSPISLTQPFKTDLTLAAKRLPNLDLVIQRQRDIARRYASSLRLPPGMLCLEQPGAFYNRYQYPILFPTQEQRDAMAKHLLKTQIDTSRPLDEVAGVATHHYGYANDCPTAERLSKRTLVIPSYHSLTDKEVDSLAQSVNDGWSQIENRAHAAAGTLAGATTG
jgi:dTDP-4-amino-4,6-dideoxygalactose transaminase